MAASSRSSKAKLARTLQLNPAADVSDLRILMHQQSAEERIRAVVEQAPPFTPEQAARLAALFQGVPDEKSA